MKALNAGVWLGVKSTMARIGPLKVTNPLMRMWIGMISLVSGCNELPAILLAYFTASISSGVIKTFDPIFLAASSLMLCLNKRSLASFICYVDT